jgi:predicted aminopeptidase
MFHELSHQVIYVRDDSTFNESFAVAVERAGLRRWLSATGRGPELKSLDDAQRRSAEFLALLAATRSRLEALYRSALPPAAMRERKRAEFDALRTRYEALQRTWGGHAGHDRFFAGEPNNALLASFATYTGLVPAFERLLGEAQGEFGAFYESVKKLAALEPAERLKRLNALR